MLSGVTGGLLPPPPQASSNPDRKKLDTKARELNRITSSQSVSKASLSHSAFVERVPGARAAFAGDACRGRLLKGAPAECGDDLPIRGQAETRYSRVLGTCKDYVAVVCYRSRAGASDRGERPGGRQAEKILPNAHALLSVSIHESVTTASGREVTAKGNRVCYGGRRNDAWSVDPYCVRSRTTAALS